MDTPKVHRFKDQCTCCHF